MSSPTELTALLLRGAPADGTHATQIAGRQIMRSASPTVATPHSLCLVAQGRKQEMLGTQGYSYRPQLSGGLGRSADRRLVLAASPNGCV